MVMSLKLANPAPLGLLGFGLTTVLLNLHNAGLFPIKQHDTCNGHSITVAWHK